MTDDEITRRIRAAYIEGYVMGAYNNDGSGVDDPQELIREYAEDCWIDAKARRQLQAEGKQA